MATPRRGISGLMIATVLALNATGVVGGQEPTSTPVVQTGNTVGGGLTPAAAKVWGTVVALHLRRVSLEDAITALSNAAHLNVTYSIADFPAGKTVSLDSPGIAVHDALDIMLEGTALEAAISSTGRIRIRERDLALPQQGTGTVSGYVRDSANGRGLAQATVHVDGTSLEAKTGLDGAFKITGLAAGEYRIMARRVGYIATSRSVTVTDGETKTLTFSLNQPTTKLDEVVTTALGEQRRYQVGNSITSINVDSLAPTAPVTSVTDLISGRAPGVDILENSGLLGGGEAIRIRGISSMELQSDPIIIVDGIRQDNSPGSFLASTGGQLNGSHPTPDRLNDLNFDDIATIDVLKGPAASTEYGTDAANGVIVITTKHGTAGPPTWHADAQDLYAGNPIKFPQTYYAYGHLANGSGTSVNCVLSGVDYYLVSETAGNCMVDSIIGFNPLNNASTTLFTPGGGQRYDLSVTGGSDAIQYFLAAGTTNETGALQMPPALHSLIDSVGLAFPNAAFHSNSEQQRSARLNTSIKLGSSADVSVNANYLYTATVTPSIQNLFFGMSRSQAIDNLQNMFGYNLTAIYGGGYDQYDSPLGQLSNIGTDQNTRLTSGATANWRPTGWFVAHATVGIDHGIDRQEAINYPTGNNPQFGNSYGSLNLGTIGTDIYTVDLRATATAAVTSSLRSMTSAGLQLAETNTNGVVGNVNNISIANLTLDGYSNPAVSQNSNDVATLGGYGEEEVDVNDRLFLTAAVRIDGASGFGNDYAVAAYPKLSFSWLTIKTPETTVRLRGALGISGQQPQNGASQVLYTANTVYLNAGVVPGESIEWPGNPHLQPERSEEYEGGFDVDGWGSRLSLEFTLYQKTTHDALNNLSFAGDLCCYTEQQNLGEIQNSGVEATANFGLVQSRALDWELTLGGSINHSKLVSVAPTALTPSFTGNGTRDEVGFPLAGLWADPVRYTDINRDGILEVNEVSVGDTLEYQGPGEPTQMASISSHLGLWHGAVSINMLFNYQGGYKIYNNILTLQDYFASSPQSNFPTAPLWRQSGVVGNKLANQDISPYFENGDMMRWRELSVTYSIPRAVARSMHVVQTLSITGAVRNLALWTKYGGPDPETSNGSFFGNNIQTTPAGTQEANNDIRADSGSIPLLRSWMIRLNVGLR